MAVPLASAVDDQVAVAGENALLHLGGGNRAVRASGLGGVSALIIGKEKGPILRDRPAQGESVLIAVLDAAVHASSRC